MMVTSSLNTRTIPEESMTAPTAEVTGSEDLSSLTGKRINLSFRQKDSADVVTQEGRVEMASPVGLMFKEKGKSNVQLIEADQIDSWSALAPKEANVTRKKLHPIAPGRVRQHLADRHGLPVAEVNELSEADAEKQHDTIDHSVLGHTHEEPAAASDAAAAQPSDGGPISDVSDVEGAEPEPEDDDQQ